MQPWKTTSRQVILNHSKYLTVESHTIELPDGQVMADWSWIITPDYVNVAVITRSGEYLCFRQTKYAVDGITLASIGGYLEPGEGPLTAAKRELREETGYEATTWLNLGSYAVDGNRGSGTAHLFLARDAYKVMEITSDDLEEQELLYLSRTEIEAALRANEFKVLANAMVFALALHHTEA